MAVKVAINGFGRIGRLVFRALVEQGLVGKDIEVVAVGDIVPADNLAYLLKYDTAQGRFNGTVSSKKSAADKAEDDVLVVNADRGRFLQVAFNMVANAVKFSSMGTSVRVTTVITGAFVRFEVHDTGPGVSQERREQLFTRFGRVHEDSLPTIAGTGLGLYVSRMLIGHMGGEIGYRPGEMAGSVFWFTLPRITSEAPLLDSVLATVGCTEPASA